MGRAREMGWGAGVGGPENGVGPGNGRGHSSGAGPGEWDRGQGSGVVPGGPDHQLTLHLGESSQCQMVTPHIPEGRPHGSSGNGLLWCLKLRKGFRAEGLYLSQSESSQNTLPRSLGLVALYSTCGNGSKTPGCPWGFSPHRLSGKRGRNNP